MAERIAENVWTVQGTTLHMPVVIRDATLAAAVFACRAAAARRALAGTGLEPLVLAGRGLATLLCVRYREGDLGQYNEVGLLIAVRGPDGKIGAYTLELPVTQEFTLEAGRDIWALPKWLAECDLAVHGRRTTVRLATCAAGDTPNPGGGAFVLAAALDAGRVPLPVPVTARLTTYSVRSGRVLRGRPVMRLRGVRLRPGGARLVLGDHRMAETARDLGMAGRPLCTLTVPRLAMRLGEWQFVTGAGR